MVELWMRMGSTCECKLHRGLLAADHAAQAFIGNLDDRVRERVERSLPRDQYGGRKGGGTDFPAHVVQSLIKVARMAGLSIFLFFVDLVAAYDSVVRKVAFGVPHDFAGSLLEYLLHIHIDRDVAVFVDSFGL